MKNDKTRIILLTALSVVSAFVVLRHEILSLNKTEWFIFDAFETLFWLGLGILIAIPTTINAVKSYKRSSSKSYFIPIIILGSATFLSLGLQFVHTENNSPVILSAHYDGDTNGISLKLREDRTYGIENYSILGGEFIEGNYILENDTIYMDRKEPIGNDFINDKLVVTKDKILFHLDKNGNFDTVNYFMRIIENP